MPDFLVANKMYDFFSQQVMDWSFSQQQIRQSTR